MPVLPEYSLADKTAIFYTAGGDEAPVLAQALSEAGAAVFAVARRRESLDAVLEALDGGKGRKHGGVVADVGGQPDEAAEVINAFDRLHSRVDILVNDARSALAKPVAEITPEEWDAVHSRNGRAVFLLCQAVAPRMVEQESGRIVNVISELAERGLVNGTAFNASQAVVLSLTRSLALELGRHNIRVNAVGTGWYTAEDVPLEVQQQELLVRYIPLRRKGRPQDVTSLLVYLCSDACDYTTGQPVYVDGGLNAHP